MLKHVVMLMRLATIAYISAFSLQSFAATGHPACLSGQHWVTAHHQSAYVRADGTPVSAANVRAHCQANSPAYAVWASRLKGGMPPRWEMRGEHPKIWTDDERERVLEALGALPDVLLNVPPQNIYRLTKSSSDSENPGSGHDNDIALYDPAFDPKQNLSRVLAHELAHKLYDQFGESDAEAYNTTAGWRVKRTDSGARVFVPRMDGFVEEDGEEGPNEDFSNNIEYFLFDPKALHERTPKVYDWIQQKYGKAFKLKGPEK